MDRSPDTLSALQTALAALGLRIVGGLVIDESLCPEGHASWEGRAAILVGNTGPRMWDHLEQSVQMSDGRPDPLNRWTEAVGARIASEWDCGIAYPFAKPWWPFQRLAMAAAGLQPSPLGILIDPEFGLWHALRFLLVPNPDTRLAEAARVLAVNRKDRARPCDTCEEKPCLTACPVDAFDGKTLDRTRCFSHLETGNDPDCMALGCRARDACPVGREHRYDDAQIRFHMAAYRRG